MKICALLGGILDPKWPLPPGDYLQQPDTLDGIARKLSPFDEAALEVALRLRETVPSSTLAVYMPDGPGAEGLLRAVAAHKPHHVGLLMIDRAVRWDVAAFARQAAAGLHRADAGTLWLTGREFGDLDDGAFGACLARAAGSSLIAMAEELRGDAQGTLRALRTRSDVTELVRVPDACVVTLTNARTNRLRHPLMKNVMLAKKLAIGRVACDGDGTAAPRVVPAKLLEAVGASGSKPVPLAASAGIDAQVNAVLEFLHSVCPT
jgi:electron transfer flavoprotein beta subunit